MEYVLLCWTDINNVSHSIVVNPNSAKPHTYITYVCKSLIFLFRKVLLLFFAFFFIIRDAWEYVRIQNIIYVY